MRERDPAGMGLDYAADKSEAIALFQYKSGIGSY